MWTNFFEHLDFQGPQLAVGDDEKVAAATGRIKKAQLAEPLLKGNQFGNAAAVTARLETAKLRPQFVEKQRLNDLEYVLFGGVVCALLPALVLVHYRLKKRAKNRRGDVGPIEVASVDEPLAHSGIKRRNEQRVAEQVAVDVGEAGEVFVEGFGAAVFGRVEHLE